MSGNNSDKNNNQENNIGGENMTVDTDTNNNAMTHDHEPFVHQIRLFSGPRQINNLVQPLYKLKNAFICILDSQFRNIIS